MSVLYPSEISLNDLELGEKNDHVNGDFSRPIYHNGEALVIQLSNAIDLFGVLDYRNPNGQTQNAKFSTGICMSNSNPVTKHFVQLVENLEKMVIDEFAQPEWEFVSTIKSNRKGERHLRVKLPFKYNTMQFEMYNNKQKVYMDMQQLRMELVHGRSIDVILQLNPVWCSGKKFGISWKLCAVDFHTKQFRKQQTVNNSGYHSPKPRRKRARRRGRRNNSSPLKPKNLFPKTDSPKSDNPEPPASPQLV